MSKSTLVKYEASLEKSLGTAGEMTEPQVEEIVRHLVCRNLTEDDVMSSSLFAD